jgi:hypothetical protein
MAPPSSTPSHRDPEVIGPVAAPNTMPEASKRPMDPYERFPSLSMSLSLPPVTYHREEERERLSKSRKYEKHQDRFVHRSSLSPLVDPQQESNQDTRGGNCSTRKRSISLIPWHGMLIH